MTGTPSVGPLLGLVLAAFAVLAVVLVRFGGLGLSRDMATAALRAVVQLSAVSLLIAGVLRSGALTGCFIAAMLTVAAFTAARRVVGRTVRTLRASVRAAGWTALAIGAGAVPALVLMLATRLVPLRPVAVLPIAGILIGGAMTATALTGRRALDDLRLRRGEYEGGLALGLPERDAALEVCRPAAALALVPAIDQTRTVGLVTLPGAFVGVLLGGASPVQAGAAQLLVLIALLAVEAASALLMLELVAAGHFGDGRDYS
ncbi:ABC transporter permease [Actinomadura rupiterrae]|uniref:ABC transporter permease n=1 Tax=Actinomadura rupiterrae TaxID=559627 RepID=UPI0020A510E1|nr:ABC transporter permease [Actinomadura rupiterrae]MCP2340231.1 putative ABC transport system permease protein [Actinomadura rupiterrae]